MSVIASIRGRAPGAPAIVVATAVAGGLSYGITWAVPRSIGFADYATFAVVWSAVYLVVGALAGLGQETARATHEMPDDSPPARSPIPVFAGCVCATVTVVVFGSGLVWGPVVFPREGWSLVLPVAIGAGGYVIAAIASGTFAGLQRWSVVALFMIVDAGLRAAAVAAVLVLHAGVIALAWAVALPFGAAVLVLWPLVGSLARGRARVDRGARAMILNSLRTVVAGIAIGVMITGLPLLIVASSTGTPARVLGLVVLSVTLVRAPLVVLAQSLQTYLVVRFRTLGPHAARAAVGMVLGVVILGGVLSALAASIGPTVFRIIFPAEPIPSPLLLAVLVMSSALLAVCVGVGSATLARGAHSMYAAGWIVGAMTTITVLVLPGEIGARTGLATLLGPATSLVVWSAYLGVSSRRSSGAGG